jgi:ferrous iron transport protein B
VKDITAALIGNPNSGKTTVFNKLTGSSQHVGNWPGVTIERKEGRIKGYDDLHVVDLPGIYSLSPYTPEEIVSRDYLLSDDPDVVVNIIDASNLERNLYLTTQVLEMGLPTVLVLNMMDDVRKAGAHIDHAKLSMLTGCQVIETVALRNEGTGRIGGAISRSLEHNVIPIPFRFSDRLESCIAEVTQIIHGKVPERSERWYAMKLIEKDETVTGSLKDAGTDRVDAALSSLEKDIGDDSQEIVADERYRTIRNIISAIFTSNGIEITSLSSKVDRIVTNKWLGIPLFIAVMGLVYYISITTVGGYLTTWVNDEFFGTLVVPGTREFLEGQGVDAAVVSLVSDGIVSGVGSVLGFLPEIFILFLLLVMLEECGYMSRVAFVMDRIFRHFGLSGRSVIPMVIGTGCGVPGIMASRTIESERERRITAMTTTFIPCSAKLPIIAMIAGALFNNSAAVALSAYFLGISMILISGILLNKMGGFAGRSSPFVMEMPNYHMPLLVNVLKSACERAAAFVKKAGTFILLSCVIVWFLSSFDWSLELTDDLGSSMLAGIGNAFTFIFIPLGFGEHWEFTVATITGLLAKENVVGTFGVLFGLDEDDSIGLWGAVSSLLSPVAGYAFLVFNLICAPCFAAIGAMRRELGSWKDTGKAVLYQCILAYAVALIVYQFGMLFVYGTIGAWTIAAMLILAFLIYALVAKDPFGSFARIDAKIEEAVR